MSRANEPVFPVARDLSGTMNYGLSVREEFAKAAMQGLNANPQWADQTAARRYARAVADADGLLSELAKPVSP